MLSSWIAWASCSSLQCGGGGDHEHGSAEASAELTFEPMQEDGLSVHATVRDSSPGQERAEEREQRPEAVWSMVDESPATMPGPAFTPQFLLPPAKPSSSSKNLSAASVVEATMANSSGFDTSLQKSSCSVGSDLTVSTASLPCKISTVSACSEGIPEYWSTVAVPSVAVVTDSKSVPVPVAGVDDHGEDEERRSSMLVAACLALPPVAAFTGAQQQEPPLAHRRIAWGAPTTSPLAAASVAAAASTRPQTAPSLGHLREALLVDKGAGPLANFLREALSCSDLEMSPWIWCPGPQLFVQKSDYTMPLPKELKSTLGKAFNLPSRMPGITLNRLRIADEAIVLVQTSRTTCDGLPQGSRFAVQNTHIFRADGASGLEWREWVDVFWDHSLPWSQRLLARIVESRIRQDAKGTADQFADILQQALGGGQRPAGDP